MVDSVGTTGESFYQVSSLLVAEGILCSLVS